MASILLQTNKINRSVRYYSLEESRMRFKRLAKAINLRMWAALILFWVSPFFCIFFIFSTFIKFFSVFVSIFMKNEAYMRQYNVVLQPQTANKVVSIIGYRIYDEELDGHLSIIKSGDAKALANKQKIMEKPFNKLRYVGIDTKLAKTHIVLVGKTGAGKTECLRSIMDDVMKSGGGINFNDGKSDVKMLTEIMTQAKENYRETSVRVLNFLKSEKSAESNTFNFLNNQHPVKAVEFLSSLAFKEGGDGNHAHFQNRGKALLLPVISSLYIKNQLLGEGLDSEKIRDNTQTINLCLIYIHFYCICRDIDNIIAQNQAVVQMISGSSIVFSKTDYFDNIEKLLATIIQEPTKKNDIEQKLGIDYAFIKDCYTNIFRIISSYMANIWDRFIGMLECMSLVVYAIGKTENNGVKSFYALNATKDNLYSSYEIKSFYNRIKDEIIAKSQQAQANSFEEEDIDSRTNVLAMVPTFLNQYGRASIKQSTFLEALNNAFTAKDGQLEKPPADAIQQHSYAQQQWDRLFNVFTSYKHIMAQPKSEINPVDLIADNQILYVLLPPLEKAKEEVEILGKIIIMTIKNFAGMALGGEYISVYSTIRNIAKDKFTPKPFTLINLDEYGAYPVGDIDTILAQVRSLNMSVVLGIQDFVSLKTSGTDETAQKRALANTTKMVFKVADEDVIRWLDTMITEQEVEKSQYKRDAAGELVLDVDVRIEKEKIVPFKKVEEADNGFCLLLKGSDSEGAIWLQTFYRGGKSSSNVKIIHTKNIDIKDNIIKDSRKGFDFYKDELFKETESDFIASLVA